MATSGRTLLVANRLPVTVREDRGNVSVVPSAGGLATALRGVHEQSDSLWFGWPGDMQAASKEGRAAVEDELRRLRAVHVPMSPSEVAHYYDGFSNGVLWPLFHYLTDKVRLDAEHDFQVYRQVNRRFAEAVAREHRPGDVVWIHDYQLALVPEYLRRLCPEAKIGFFLHIPFPSAEVFRILPWRGEILRGMLGADLIGFHTAGYRHNFAHSAALILGIDMGVDSLHVDDREVRIGVHPIGIDAGVFERAAEQPEILAEVERLRRETGGKRIVLGIDRLDYTKGIPRRLLAIDRFLREAPAARHKVHFLQVAVPTREKVDAYADLRRTVNELSGRLSAHHGTPSGSPLQLLYRAVSFSQLVALYRAADVMLVTPLRDGMNLVAKEYVASRTDERGTLVLSELAGAADELPEALSVNPYDLSGIVRALVRALEMPAEEQRARMGAMRARVRQNQANGWAERFLRELRDPAGQASAAAVPGAAPSWDLGAAVRAARAAPARVVILDYDGTLVPLAPLPELAAPPPQVLDVLRSLAATPRTEVHVITGRGRASIERWLGALPIVLHAEHGFWSRWTGPWLANGAALETWKERIRPLLADTAARTPGAFVEEKTTALALHYRGSDPTMVAERLRGLRALLQAALPPDPLELLEGSKVLEVRLLDANKGRTVRKLVADLHPDAAILAAGDDRTDEDMFAALPDRAIKIRVGDGQTRATYRVKDPEALLSLLRGMVEPAQEPIDSRVSGASPGARTPSHTAQIDLGSPG